MLDVTRRDDDLLFVELVNRQLRERLELLLCLILTIKREWHHVDKYELRKKLLENLFDRNGQTSGNGINLVSDILVYNNLGRHVRDAEGFPFITDIWNKFK